MPATTPNATTIPQLRGRRFRSMLCEFHAVGVATRAPEYAHTRRGQARATLSLWTDQDRILELIIMDRDEPTLKNRLAGITTGSTVYAQGTVRPPHAHRQELPQFYADTIFGITPNGVLVPQRGPTPPVVT